MSEWIPLTAAADIQLPDLLDQYGLSHEPWELVGIWGSSRNKKTLQDAPRPPYLIKGNETWYVPPPPLSPCGVLRTYTCTGSEQTTSKVVDAIKVAHGAGSDEQLAVADAEFTETYLLDLPYNQLFAARRKATATALIQAGETVRYPVSRMRMRVHDVAPATSIQDASSVLPTGEGPFDVKVELAESGQVLRVLDLTTNPEDPSLPPQNTWPHPLLTPVAAWRATTVKFKVGIQPKNGGDLTPSRVTIFVHARCPSSDTEGATDAYFTEELKDGAWLENGDHVWEWDGFTKPKPTRADEPDTAQVDTRVLRGSLTVEVVVDSPSGWSRGVLHLANKPAKAGFVDVQADLATKVVHGFAYLEIHNAAEDEGLWFLSLLAAGILSAGVIAGTAIAMAIDEYTGDPLSDEEKKKYELIMGLAAPAIFAAAAFLSLIFAAPMLSPSDLEDCKEDIAVGIGKHWRQDVLIDGKWFQFYGRAIEDEDRDHVRFAVMSELPTGQRACNLSLPFPFAPIVFPYRNAEAWHHTDNQETAAHEFGHSILNEAFSKSWSQRHKGSSTEGTQAVIEGDDGFKPPQPPPPPATPAPPPPPPGPSPAIAAPVDPVCQRDLMIYYDEGGTRNLETWDRTFATPIDALGWIAIAQVEFRALADDDA